MGAPTRPNQGPAAIIGAKTAEEKAMNTQIRLTCCQLAVQSFGQNGWHESKQEIIDRASSMFNFITDNEGDSTT